MCRPANGCRFPNDRATTGAAGKPAQSLVFRGCRGSSKAGRLHSLPRCQNYGPLAPGLDGPRLRALGATARPYQSPALVNARLPRVNWAAGKTGRAGGWRPDEPRPPPGRAATPLNCGAEPGPRGRWSTGIASRCWMRRARPARSRSRRSTAARAAAKRPESKAGCRGRSRRPCLGSGRAARHAA
jgi:hypothetical protein